MAHREVVLSTRPTGIPGPEHFTVQEATSPPLQDGQVRFTGSWHLQRVDPLPGELAHAGLTECGMPGKIGLNAAGVAVHLNILRNDADDAGGVPVHAVLARVLLLVLGAAFNAESERQTARDSTVGAERPPGRRGAVVADDIPPHPEDEPTT